MAVLTGTQTLADLLNLPEDGRQYELLGGELVYMPPPSVRHMVILTALFAWCYDAQRAGYGIAGLAPCAIGLDYPERGLRGIDAPQPDIFFVRKEQQSIVQGQFIQGVPDLIIEVLSPKTRRKDRSGGSKWQTYERNHVPHYWIVDSAAQTVTQYAYQAGQFAEVAILRPGDLLVCPLFPTMPHAVADIFADIPS